jgi:acetyl-CoA C-acetyltransferase
MKDMDIVEMNEALHPGPGLRPGNGCGLDKTNLNGSGISIGHPVGCTGARDHLQPGHAAAEKKRAPRSRHAVLSAADRGWPIVLERV